MTLERPTAFVSTGELPPPERVRTLVDEAYERFASVDEGKPSQVYPALAQAPPELFGICVVGARSGVYGVGDADVEFTIMSVAEALRFRARLRDVGPGRDEAPRRRERHRSGVQLADRDRAGRRGPDEPDGQLRGHRDRRPRARHNNRGPMVLWSITTHLGPGRALPPAGRYGGACRASSGRLDHVDRPVVVAVIPIRRCR
jgi:hypothetical protein